MYIIVNTNGRKCVKSLETSLGVYSLDVLYSFIILHHFSSPRGLLPCLLHLSNMLECSHYCALPPHGCILWATHETLQTPAAAGCADTPQLNLLCNESLVHGGIHYWPVGDWKHVQYGAYWWDSTPFNAVVLDIKVD